MMVICLFRDEGVFTLDTMMFFKIVLQITGLIVINKIGFYFVEFLNLPIPGNVAGLIILFLLLWTKVVKLEWIEEASNFLVRHLSFFFVSVSVGLMTIGGLLAKNGLQLAIVLIASAVIGMAIAGFAAQLVAKRKEGTHSENIYHDL
jgi:holin-like protein